MIYIYILLFKLKSFLEGNIYIYNPNKQLQNMNIFHYKELIKEK